MTAIIVAGRSASAFTAAKGPMKMREEIDAMRVLGLSKAPIFAMMIALVGCFQGLQVAGNTDDSNAAQNRWGVMFQDGALFFSLTVRQNVGAPMREKLMINTATRSALAELRIAMVGLPATAGDLYPSKLIGGMRKRAGLARALALDPQILFLDKPTAGPDPISASECDNLILSLQKALGLTALLVTQDLSMLLATCNRIAVLARKKVQLTGTMAKMMQVDDPWVRSGFRGPRAHAGQMQVRSSTSDAA